MEAEFAQVTVGTLKKSTALSTTVSPWTTLKVLKSASSEINFLVKLYFVELNKVFLLTNVVIIMKLDILKQIFHSQFMTNNITLFEFIPWLSVLMVCCVNSDLVTKVLALQHILLSLHEKPSLC